MSIISVSFAINTNKGNKVVSDKGSEIKILLPFFDERLCGHEDTAVDKENGLCRRERE